MTIRDKIAIIGIGCRFPGGANDYVTFWQNLIDGKDCLIETPHDRYNAKNLYSKDKAKRGRLTGGRGGYIDGFDRFDAGFFGIGGREAQCMDPQQRKLLEVTFEAFEDAGQKPFELADKNVGAFIGGFTLDYKIVQFADLSFNSIEAHTATGTMMTILSNRLSYCFDLNGPSMSVDTACSSSLVCVHLACNSLWQNECNMALAGGVLLHMTPQYTVAESKGGFLSQSGRSCTFDASAEGYVRSEGVAVVLLKRLSDAIKDNDPIHAVIIASGVNQDGHTNGITSPNGEAQSQLIQRVCEDASISPGDLQYVEAHGTSTPVGDPIEANALSRVLSIGRKPDSSCYIGSVKTNIGHTESAAGMAGLIKTALSLKHKIIPPHINFKNINPAIELGDHVKIPTAITPWPQHDGMARAGVNSFGFGGTNAHVLLEEPPPALPRALEKDPKGIAIMPFSARDPEDLPRMIERFRRHIHESPESELDEIGFTLGSRRQHLPARLSLVYSNKEELLSRMDHFLTQEADPYLLSGQAVSSSKRRLVWSFSGMGPQWWAMGRQLFESEPVYREALMECAREMKRHADWCLIDELNRDEQGSNMNETWLAQPANFALQVALARLWRSYGIKPDAIVGHSTGEAAAFYEAGVYSLKDAVRIIIHRSRLQQKLVGTGTMLAVGLREIEVKPYLEPYEAQVAIAAINSPSSITLSGEQRALEELSSLFKQKDIFAKFLSVRVPYHSPAMDAIKQELLDALAFIEANPADIPLYLTGRTGKALGPELDNNYWWDNVRQSVRFSDAIGHLIDDGYDLFLEVGPHPVLGHAISECLSSKEKKGQVFPSIRRKEDERYRMKASLASFHNLGFVIDWSSMFLSKRVVTLPGYPWKEERYWSEAKEVKSVRLGELDHPILGRRLALAEPCWESLLDVEQNPYLNDHRIMGDIIFPAAGYVEMASQAMGRMTGAHQVSLSDVNFEKALFIPEDETKAVQFLFNRETSRFIVASLKESESITHASGFLRKTQTKEMGDWVSAQPLMDRAKLQYQASDCYERFKDKGYHYGTAFQTIEQIWIGDGEALAKLTPSAALDAHDGGLHHFHMTLLDGCFQALLAARLFGDNDGTDSRLLLPINIKDIHIKPIGCCPLWVYARVIEDRDAHITGDIQVFSDSHEPLALIAGFKAEDAESRSNKASLATIDNWLAEEVFISRPEVSLPDSIDTTKAWLILDDEQGLGQALAQRLKAMGCPHILVSCGKGCTFDDEGRRAGVDPRSHEHLERLLRFYGDRKIDLKNIICLWPLKAKGIADSDISALSSSNIYGTYPLIALAKAMLKVECDAQLVVVTKGAQKVVEDDCPEPLPASCWGLFRVLCYQELSNNQAKIIDLDPRSSQEPSADDMGALAIIKEVLNPDDDEIALRNQLRLTSRLKAPNSLTAPLSLNLRQDGCYLITGAMGALGQLLSKTLVKCGARKLILLGRSELPKRRDWHLVGPDERAFERIRFIKELEEGGAEVIFSRVDMADENSFSAFYRDFENLDLPPIRGVFHLAGEVKDALIADMDDETFDSAYRPKVLGSFLLHKYLIDEPLDHFVMFSSMASVLTTAGQTNYAAGNAFMDALAKHRRSRGLCGLSIGFGPWATGMIEELGLIEHYRSSRGMSSLAPDIGMEVFKRLMGQDVSHLVVATIIDWPLFLSWYAKPLPLVLDIKRDELIDSGTEQKKSFADQYHQAPDDQKPTMLKEHFCRLLSDVLHLPSSSVEPGLSLNELGLDSLLAIELRARINREFKVALPVVTLLSNATIKKLQDKIGDGLDDQCSALHLGTSQQVEVDKYTDKNQYPLTKNQTALWFLKHLDPDGFAYNIGGAVEIHTKIDAHLMFEAVRQLILRHDSLRANFVQVDGQAVQKISAEPKQDIALIDVADKEWDEIYQMIIREYRKPYDLAQDPLMRFRLFRLADDRWIMMKAVHHIISDAISTFLFIEELLELYEGMKRGQKVELLPVKSSYLDFLNWQNNFLATPEANKMFEYWQKHLPTAIPVLNLPTDKPRPSVQTHNGASEFFVLDEELSKAVHDLAKDKGMTVFMILLSAYYALLHRYSGQDHIIVGSPVMGRTEQEFSSVYGYFVNPLPLHVDLSANPNTDELLKQVQEVVLNGLDNQEYPFVMLVDKLALKHDSSRSAVFQAMFILLIHRVATEKYGYKLNYIELPEEEGQFDITMSIYENEVEGRFHCVFKYNSDLFFEATIKAMAGHYINLLRSMIDCPEKPVHDLEMIDERERDQLLFGFSGARHQEYRDHSIIDLIDQQAERDPDAIAICMPDEGRRSMTLSYQELKGRSDLFAHNLKEMGIGQGSLVALCLPKSIQLLVSLLGVLKSGAAYVPLDPEHPRERLEFMLRHVGVDLVLLDEANIDLISGFKSMRADDPRFEMPILPTSKGSLRPDSLDDLAYIIYTSGSTGVPKAVKISHKNLIAVYTGWEKQYGLKDGIRVHAQMANVAFDVFVGDVMRALCSGGTLTLIDRDRLLNTEKLYQTLKQESVDCGEFVPAIVRGLIKYCREQELKLDFLKLIIVGSDAWLIKEFKELRALCDGKSRLINSYGLSEATIDSTYFEGSVDHLEPGAMVPIGTPFTNSEVYVLDPRQKLVPKGVPGELWVSGAGISDGYANDQQLSDERFRHIELDGNRKYLYRTGDLARFDREGCLHLLGRMDDQIKIRGHRIETGEIEAHLKALPKVSEAVVALQKSRDADGQLCAYLVMDDCHDLDNRELRQYLLNRLPSYMIPSWFVAIPHIPLSDNGKVDLKALETPTQVKEDPISPPQTLYEVRMAHHWQKILDISGLGLQDDFFEVGGSSIKLIELIYQLQSEFNISIAVSELLRSTTLFGMAKTLQDIIIGRKEGSKPYLTFNPNQKNSIFCFPPAGGHGLIYRRMAEHMRDHTLISFNYLSEEDKITHYADLIQSLKPQGACHLFGYSLGGNLAFEVARELEERGCTVEQVLIMDSYRISEQFEFGDEQLKEFEKELSLHLMKHTGSDIVAKETLEQAGNYIRFCSRTPNKGQLSAKVSVITDQDKLSMFADGERGAWHGCSQQKVCVHRGFGSHVDMLDQENVGHNVELMLNIIYGKRAS